MSRRRSWLLWGALLAFVGAVPSEGAGPPGPRNRSTGDSYGDPLPPGAIVRLGTVRFRHAGEATCVAFTRDGKGIVSSGPVEALDQQRKKPSGDRLRQAQLAVSLSRR